MGIVRRGDEVISIRDGDVDLAAVEAALASCTGVDESSATAVPDHTGSLTVIGYLTRNSHWQSIRLVRSQLGGKLPPDAVPIRLVRLETMPVNEAGTIDRAVLEYLSHKMIERDVVFSVPGTELERVVAEIWSDVLGVEPIGRDDDFLALGGHSIHATQIALRVEELLGCEMSMAIVFEYATVARLSQYITDILGPYAVSNGTRRTDTPL